tara:strand:- start:38 stop:445 length:408 start_codon:yes stop_codon:yes gene_type:complete
MGYWWLYLLVFIFGYMTHKTFYFFRSVKISIGLIRVSQLVSLGVLAKSMENFYYARTIRLKEMQEMGKSDKDIRDFKRSFNLEVTDYKNKAVKGMLDLHPKFYDPLVDFDNWNSAMKYLEDNKHFVQQLLGQNKK